MTHDEELEGWRSAWRADEGVRTAIDPEAVRRDARRKGRRLVLLTISETLLAVAGLVALGVVGWRSRDRADAVATGALGILVLFHSGLALFHRRGILGTPSAETTRALLDLAIVRGERRLREVRAGWALLAIEIAVFVPWIWHRLTADGPPDAATFAGSYGFLATLVAAAAVFLGWLKRRTERDLSASRRLRRQLDSAADGP